MLVVNETEITEDEICECGHRLDRHSAPLVMGGFFYVFYYGCDVELCDCADLLENKPDAVPFRKDYKMRAGATVG